MSRNIIDRNLGPITLVVIFFIVYGSLFPFDFHPMPPGAVHALVSGWNKRPGRGDLLSNILLYMPLGYFGFLSLGSRIPAVLRVLIVFLLGVSLSVSIELTQYYDAGRDTEATDVYANAAGTVFGIIAALWLNDLWKKLPRQRIGDPAAVLLLGAWAAYNLFPFVPVIDLHKYWGALKPLLYDGVSWYGLFTHTAVWTAVAVLVHQAVQGQRAALLFAAFAAFLLGAKIFVTDGVLTAAEIGGGAIALILMLALQSRPRLWLAAATLLQFCSVMAQRLEPFHFAGPAHPFGWIPFLGFMHGSIQVDTLSFLEKGFLYGSLIWLLEKIGLRLPLATLGVAAILLATSFVEVHLPGRSAEITDAVMALLIGSVIALVRKAAQRSEPAAQPA